MLPSIDEFKADVKACRRQARRTVLLVVGGVSFVCCFARLTFPTRASGGQERNGSRSSHLWPSCFSCQGCSTVFGEQINITKLSQAAMSALRPTTGEFTSNCHCIAELAALWAAGFEAAGLAKRG